MRALGVCMRLQPSHPLVLFMEGRLQLAISCMTAEEKAAIREQQLPLPEANLEAGVAKMRASIEADGSLLDSYIVLACLLVKSGKIAEARGVIAKGLAVERYTKSDEDIAAEMSKLNSRLEAAGQ